MTIVAKVFMSLFMTAGLGLSILTLLQCDGSRMSAESVATPSWRAPGETWSIEETPGTLTIKAYDGSGHILVRKHQSGLLFGESDSDQVDESGEPFNPVSKPIDPHGAVYYVSRAPSGLPTIAESDLSHWRQAPGPVAYLDKRWNVEHKTFTVTDSANSRGLMFNGNPVSLAGSAWFSGPHYNPDGKLVAVLSARGPKYTQSAFPMIAGGPPTEYGGPFYVELFSTETGKRIGQPMRLRGLERTHHVLGNWTPDGEYFYCLDCSYKRLWIIGSSEFALSAVGAD